MQIVLGSLTRFLVHARFPARFYGHARLLARFHARTHPRTDTHTHTHTKSRQVLWDPRNSEFVFHDRGFLAVGCQLLLLQKQSVKTIKRILANDGNNKNSISTIPHQNQPKQ
jgi:hypothetical protein